MAVGRHLAWLTYRSLANWFVFTFLHFRSGRLRRSSQGNPDPVNVTLVRAAGFSISSRFVTFNMNRFILVLFLATPCTAFVTVEKAFSLAQLIANPQTDLRYGNVTYGIMQGKLNGPLYNFTKLLITKDMYSRLFHFATNDQCKLQLLSILNELNLSTWRSYSCEFQRC